jgi:signal transduction histidine kinase
VTDRPARILVVDDNEAGRYVVGRVLRAAGFEVWEGTSGAEALRMAKRGPDLVVLDVRLPDMSGLEVCRTLKSDPDTAHVAVLQTSARFVSPEWRAVGLEGGADGYLVAPVDPEELVATVRALLRARAAEERVRSLLLAEKAARRAAERVADRMSVLQSASTALATLLDERRIGEVVVPFAIAATGAAAGAIWFDRVQEGVVRGYASGKPDEPFLEWERLAGERAGPVHQVLEDARPRFDDGSALLPIGQEGRPAGVLALVFPKPREFPREERQFLLALAGQCGLALARSRIYERERKTLEELQRSNRDLEHFAYVASHDLQEPLRVVSVFAQLLGRRLGTTADPETAEALRFLKDGSRQMLRMVEGLLEYARLTDMSPEDASVDLSRALAQALTNLEVAIRETGADVRYGPLPVVRGQETQFVRLFQNLVANALKFRRDLPPLIRIEAAPAPTDESHHLVVADNGIGIPPDQLPKVFRLFTRLNDREAYPGAGLGLAICQRIVERHGGSIWAESDGRSGSSFHITLPRAV